MKTRQPGLIFIPPTVEAINFLESYDLSRFEGEGGSESPETAEEAIDVALENIHRAAAVKPKLGETMKSPPGRGDAGVGTLQPIIVTDRGQVRVWCGTAAPDPKRLARSYELLGKDAKRVFPLRFESEVELADGPVRGNVPGFLVLENFQTRRTRTVI